VSREEVDFNGKCILITGAAGFIGSNLCFYFQEHFPGAIVVAFDRFRDATTLSNGNLKSFGHYKNLVGFGGVVISGDIAKTQSLERLFRLYRFDYIFHQAAISDTTATEQGLVVETNVNAFEDIVTLAAKHQSVLVYASSAAVYGNSQSPQTVGTEDPENVYGFSKLMMDNLTMTTLNRTKGLTIVGLRYFNVFGPREFFKSKTASTVLQFGLQILSGKAPKLFEGSEKILRDFVFIKDVVQANIRAAVSGRSGVYNVGTGHARSFREIEQILQLEFGTAFQVEYIPNPYTTHYQYHTEADIRRTQCDLGFKPGYSLESGIKEYAPEIKKVYNQEVYGR